MSSSELRSEADQNQFILELYAALYRVMPRRARSEDRDDVVHDAIARCVVALRRGVLREVPDNVDAFATTILRHRRIDLNRKRILRDEYDAEHFRDRNGRCPEWMLADRSNDEATNAARQQRALSVLSRECQEAFYMVRNDGMTYAQVGEALYLSRNTIHNYITRANRALRAEFRELEGYLSRSTRGGRPRRKRHAWKKERLAPKYPAPAPSIDRKSEPAGAASTST